MTQTAEKYFGTLSLEPESKQGLTQSLTQSLTQKKFRSTVGGLGSDCNDIEKKVPKTVKVGKSIIVLC